MQERYQRAGALMAPMTLLRNRTIEPRWTGESDRFRYLRTAMDGTQETVEVDPATGAVSVIPPPESSPPTTSPGALRSPDGSLEVFARDHDLWARTVATGSERQLTAGGEDGFAWGGLWDNCMVRIPMRQAGMVVPPVLTEFSPSGRYLFTARTDERGLQSWPFVEHVPATGARPVLHTIRVALDDEDHTPATEAVVIDLVSGETTKLDLASEAVFGLVMTGATGLTWSEDESRFWLLSHRTGTATASLVEVDRAAGSQRVVITETAERLYEPNQFLYSLPLVRVIPSRNAAVWFSQRDGWGHLYHYDATTGEYLGALSSGELVVRDILRIGAEAGTLLVLAGTSVEGRNPYWRSLYRLSLDGAPAELLTPEHCDHELVAPQPAFFTLVFSPNAIPVDSISPSGRYCVDHMSTVSTPPVIVLRDLAEAGRVVCELETTDDSALRATGYLPPIQFCVKADDGLTDLWGVLTLPPEPVDEAAIPVIDLMYAGYQATWQPSGYLGPGVGGQSAAPGAAYGALGFATVVLDGRGTPGRHRDFRQWTHGEVDETRGLVDHVTAIKALGREFPQLDLTRVGVTGFSYGGYNSTRSMLLFPDFFKVAVSGAGVHAAPKMPHGSWSWHTGAEVDHASDLYVRRGNLHLVDRLEGKLLLSFGELDENATPDHTLALVSALIAAGKRFDMKLWPGANHYTQSGAYMARTGWDYFVEHLLGEPLPPV